MNFLLTGASSFTGYWFTRELLAAGHRVTATFQRPLDAYAGGDPRAARVAELRKLALQGAESIPKDALRLVPECRFGEERFLALIGEGGWDLLCHHAADVTAYRSPDFDVAAALRNNTHSLPAVLKTLQAGGCTRVLLTGSVFEGDEGAGSSSVSALLPNPDREGGANATRAAGGANSEQTPTRPFLTPPSDITRSTAGERWPLPYGRGSDQSLRAFSPYGLSKQLTAEAFRYYCGREGFTLGKFVIPNPFGPNEEKRFGSYLMDCWFAGKTASVKTPDYVRDNIHVSLLARAYSRFAASVCRGKPGMWKLNPSGYVESQWRFTQRVAEEMRPRLGLACAVEKLPQTDWSEPRMRINSDPCDATQLEWDESAAWDAYAAYCKGLRA